MIYTNSKLRIIDNTGIQWIKCIKFYKYKLYSKPGRVGDLVLGSIRKKKYKKRYKKLTKGLLVKVALVRLYRNLKRDRAGPIFLGSEYSAGVILTNNLLPRGSRIREPVYQELRTSIFIKIISLARHII